MDDACLQKINNVFIVEPVDGDQSYVGKWYMNASQFQRHIYIKQLNHDFIFHVDALFVLVLSYILMQLNELQIWCLILLYKWTLQP